MLKTVLAKLTLVSFLITSIIGPVPVYAQDYHLPAPGVMVHLSPPIDPPILRGIKVHQDNPFRFDFILDKGDSELSNDQLKDESSKLIKYFLASLTIPEKDLWVNLSPYEKDRIIPNSFGLTEMGRDLLAEDYMLKQITASLIYPEDEIGKKFWKRIYEEAQKKFDTTNIPVNTFNKVWIVPEKAVVYENAKAGTAYVVESKLKVMLEQDYLSLEKHEGIQLGQTQTKDTNQLGSQIVREIVIPELTTEVNENKNFARLRQVYNSLILATWYKKKIKDSILEQVYADKNKVAGVNIDDPKEKERIYQQYLKAFKKGVYNYIKEDIDPLTQETIPRKYFSGGMDFAMNVTSLGIDETMVVNSNKSFTGDFSLLNKIARGGLAVIAASVLSLAPKAVAQQHNLKTTENNVEIAASNLTNEFEVKLKELEASLNDKTVHSEEKIRSVYQILMLFEDQPGLFKVSRREYLEGLLMNSDKAVGELAGDHLVDEYAKLFEKGQLPVKTIEGMLGQDWLHQRIAAMVLSEKIYPQMIKKNQMKLLDLKPMIKRGGIFSAVAARTFANSLDGNQGKEAFNRDEVSAVVESLLSVLKAPVVAEHPPIVQADTPLLFRAAPKGVPSSPTQEALKALLKLSQTFNGTLTFGVLNENTFDWSNMGDVFNWLGQKGYFEADVGEKFSAEAHPKEIVDEEGLKIKLAEKFPDMLKKPDNFKKLIHLLRQTYDPWGRSVLPAVRQFIDKNGYNADAYSVLSQIAHNHPSYFQPNRISYFEHMAQDQKLQGEELVSILEGLYGDNFYLLDDNKAQVYVDQLRQKNAGTNMVMQRAIAKMIVGYGGSGLVNNQYALSVPGLDGDTYAGAVRNIIRWHGLDDLVGSLDMKDLSDFAYETAIFGILDKVSEDQKKINPGIVSALSRAVQKEGMKPEVYAKLAEVIKKMPASFDPGLARVMTNDFIPNYLFDHGFACWPVYLNKYFQEQFPRREGDDHQDILRYEIASSVYRLIIGSGKEITDRNIEDGIKLIVTLRERMSDVKPFSGERTLVNILHAQERFEVGRLEHLELNSGADKNKVSSYKGVANNRKAIKKIAGSKGPLTIFSSGHGGRTQLWQEFGLRPGDDVNADMNNPNGISYKLLGDALIKRGKLDQVIILLDDCYSSDFRDNLIKYLRGEFKRKNIHETYPVVVAWADINKNSYGDVFFLDLEKAKQVTLSDILNPSRNTLGLEKPTVVVNVPDDLIKRFPQFTPVLLQLHGPSVHVPYQTAPPMIQISYNGIMPIFYYTGNWLFDSLGNSSVQLKEETIKKAASEPISSLNNPPRSFGNASPVIIQTPALPGVEPLQRPTLPKFLTPKMIAQIREQKQETPDAAMTVTLAMKDWKATDFTGQNFENMRAWLGLGIRFAPELRPESREDRDNLARLVGEALAAHWYSRILYQNLAKQAPDLLGGDIAGSSDYVSELARVYVPGLDEDLEQRILKVVAKRDTFIRIRGSITVDLLDGDHIRPVTLSGIDHIVTQRNFKLRDSSLDAGGSFVKSLAAEGFHNSLFAGVDPIWEQMNVKQSLFTKEQVLMMYDDGVLQQPVAITIGGKSRWRVDQITDADARRVIDSALPRERFVLHDLQPTETDHFLILTSTISSLPHLLFDVKLPNFDTAMNTGELKKGVGDRAINANAEKSASGITRGRFLFDIFAAAVVTSVTAGCATPNSLKEPFTKLQQALNSKDRFLISSLHIEDVEDLKQRKNLQDIKEAIDIAIKEQWPPDQLRRRIDSINPSTPGITMGLENAKLFNLKEQPKFHLTKDEDLVYRLFVAEITRYGFEYLLNNFNIMDIAERQKLLGYLSTHTVLAYSSQEIMGEENGISNNGFILINLNGFQNIGNVFETSIHEFIHFSALVKKINDPDLRKVIDKFHLQSPVDVTWLGATALGEINNYMLLWNGKDPTGNKVYFGIENHDLNRGESPNMTHSILRGIPMKFDNNPLPWGDQVAYINKEYAPSISNYEAKETYVTGSLLARYAAWYFSEASDFFIRLYVTKHDLTLPDHLNFAEMELAAGILKNILRDYTVGKNRWDVEQSILKAIQKAAQTNQILEGIHYVQLFELIDQMSPVITGDLVKQGLITKKDQAMKAKKENSDQAIKVKQLGGPGGIDLTPANMNLQTQNNGGEIKFHIDPAMLAQLQNAPGFVPVIINIQPMTDLRLFLGIKEDKATVLIG